MPRPGSYGLVSGLATRANAAQRHVVLVDRVVDPARQVLDRELQLAILEGHDGAAVGADDVVVMVAAGVEGLGAGPPLRGVDPPRQPQPVEQVERAVDRGDADGLAALVQAIGDLLRRNTAAERGERLHDRRARRAQPIAVALERVTGVSDQTIHSRHRRVALRDLRPVDDVPDRVQIVRAAVLVLEGVGVLPDVDAEPRLLAGGERVVLVGGGGHGRAGTVVDQPGPAGAELADAGVLELALEVRERPEGLVYGVGQPAVGPATARR